MSTELTISVVFTDLVGSTALATRLGPQDAEEVRQQHFAILRNALDANGGTEVKNLGDGIMAVFPSLGAALDGAVGMQQGIDRHNRSGGEELQIRIGVSTGDATEEDGDYFGEPVIEAARLEAKCQPGQILTTEMVRILQKRSDHVFRAVGELELKGIPEPVDAYEVGWEPAEAEAKASAMPLPARLAAEEPVAYIGRETEVESLTQMWKAAQNGERKVALLAGEPGIGKTRLATEIAKAAHAEGATVLYGRCDEDVAVPYQPFVEALGQYVQNADDEILAEHVAMHGGELTTLVPQLKRRMPDAPEPQKSDPETERYLLFNAVAALVAQASEVGPIVVVLDDLHWADRQTILLLRHLVVSPEPMSLLAVGTYRDTDISAGDAIVDTLADLRREPSVERIPLDGLGDKEVVAFLESMAGHDLDPLAVQLAHLVRRETAGNPFFLGEMMRHLAESEQIIVDEDGRWKAAPGIDADTIGFPESVRETVGRRLRRLEQEAMRALTAAAVIGREFGLATLSAVDDASEDDLLDILEDAERAALVSEVQDVAGRFRFMSGLIQQAIYDDLSATRQLRMHQRIAEALEEQLGADPGERIAELAHHWMAAVQPTDSAKAVEYARRAGDRALEKLAPDEAAKWYGAALDLVRDQGGEATEIEIDLLIGLGKAKRQSGDPTYRETLLEAAAKARATDDTERLVEAALSNSRGGLFSEVGKVDHEKVEVLEAAIEAMGDVDSPERSRAMALVGLETLYGDDYDKRRAVSDEAVEIARRVGDPATLAWALTFRHEAIRLPETLEERLEIMAEARELAAQAHDPNLEYWANSLTATPALEAADMAAVDDFHTKARKIAQSIGQPVLAWHSTYHDSWGVLVRGDAERGEELLTKALELGTEAGEPDAFSIYGAQILTVRWFQGRIGELVDLLKSAWEDNPALPAYQAAYTSALIDNGELEQANAMIDERIADRYAIHKKDNVWLAGLILRAMNAADLERADACEILYEMLSPWAGQVATTGASVFGSVDHALAGMSRVLGELDRAVEQYERATELNEKLQSPPFKAWTHVELARTLRLRDAPGDAARAAALLIDARTLGEQHDCGLALQRADALEAG